LRDGSANALATAALLPPSRGDTVFMVRDRPEALALIKRAVRLEPGRRDLVLLELNFCSAIAQCDTSADEARLHALDPRNGVPQMAALERARAHGSDAERDVAVIALSQARYFDFYSNELRARMMRAALKTQEIDPVGALNVINEALMVADNLQRLEETSYACHPERLSHPGVLDACRRIAKAMQRSDTLIVQLGAGVLSDWTYPAGSRQIAEVVEARRISEYRSSVATVGDSTSEAAVLRTVRFAARYPREEDMLAAEVRDAGKPLYPPPAWKPAESAVVTCPNPRRCVRSAPLIIQFKH
jgi:hypothetical protein